MVLQEVFMLVVLFSVNDSARILGIFPTPSVSHQSVFQPVWKELSLRGHRLTVITPNPLKDASLKNLTEIDVSEAYEFQKKTDESIAKKLEWQETLEVAFIKNLPQYEIMLQHPEVQALLSNPNESFDAMIVEFIQPVFFAFGAKFNCPIIGITSIANVLPMYDSLNVKMHVYTNVDDAKSIIPRFFILHFYRFWTDFYYNKVMRLHDEMARKYFGNDIPYLWDIIKNISLGFAAHNVFLNKVRQFPPNVITIGRLNIKKNEDLPQVCSYICIKN